MNHQYDRANVDFDQALLLRPGYLKAIDDRAPTRFIVGNYSGAVDDYLRIVDDRPKDANAALWLHVAARRANHPAHGALNATVERYQFAHPPDSLLIGLFLGRESAERVLELLGSPGLAGCGDCLATAYFFLGEHALINGDDQTAACLFKAAVDTDQRWNTEWHAARAELARLGGGERAPDAAKP